MASRDFEDAIKGTKEYKKNNRIVINIDGKKETLNNVRSFKIVNNQLYVNFNGSTDKSKVEYKLKSSTVINDIKASIYDVGDTGGCYLTTACITYKGLSDDCYELETLRKFRDNYLMSNDSYRSDVLEYYSFSPKLISEINGDEKTLNQIYDQLIVPCISLIEEEKYDEAFRHYKLFSLELKSKWLS